MSHSCSRLLSTVCFSSLERDLGRLPTKPQGKRQFEGTQTPNTWGLDCTLSPKEQKSCPRGPDRPQSGAGCRPLLFYIWWQRRWGKGRSFQPTGPRPGPETSVVKAELGLHQWLPVGPFIIWPWVGLTRAWVIFAWGACVDPAGHAPQSHPHPRGLAPRPCGGFFYLPAPTPPQLPSLVPLKNFFKIVVK